MKNYSKMLLGVLVIACSACQRDSAREFLPGRYTNSAVGELSKAYDTLVVEPADGNNFLIHRKTGFNLIRSGKVGKRQHEREEWHAIYDEATKTMSETRKGRLLMIYPDSGFILIGKRKYTKQ